MVASDIAKRSLKNRAAVSTEIFIARLYQRLWLKGPAKEAISSFLLHPSTMPQVLLTLHTLYERPEQIVHNLVAKVQELVDKLPANIKFNWALHQENLPVVNLKAFSEYMRKVTTATSGVTTFSIASKLVKEEKPRIKEKAFVNAHVAQEQKDPGATDNLSGDRRGQNKSAKGKGEETKICPACGAHGHTAASCVTFKKRSIDGRWNLVKDNKLCRRCLVSHTRWPCEGEVCGINNCEKCHHRLLHSEPTKKQPVIDATVTIHRQPVSSKLFKVLPVTLYGKNGSVNTFSHTAANY
ncbi:uncharacterized protein LOC135698585 [Ochlerotatus camptorhynchus]|uniref:uncharacterized protein LOC135698585 n=1 Tax=Ochlerotatus camptorhynchus TaxID=644619 RepID=UPI0031D59A71